MKEKRISSYLVLYAAYLMYSVSAVFSKYAAKQSDLKMLVVFMGAEFLFLGFYALIYQQALKRFSLGVAMSNKGVTVILALLWSALLFSEQITLFNLLGAACIVAGIWLVSSND